MRAQSHKRADPREHRAMRARSHKGTDPYGHRAISPQSRKVTEQAVGKAEPLFGMQGMDAEKVVIRSMTLDMSCPIAEIAISLQNLQLCTSSRKCAPTGQPTALGTEKR